VGAVFYDVKNTKPDHPRVLGVGSRAALVTVPKYDISIIADFTSFEIGAKLV
jgi:hypothetical protein